MKTKILSFSIIFFLAILSSCETYKKYEPEYSPAYPMSGNYYVKDYQPGALNFNDAQTGYYEMFIYGASFEPEKNIWVNTQVRLAGTSFRVKTEYNSENFTFNAGMLPHSPTSVNPPDSVTKYVTFEETQLIQKEWPEPDSIILKVTIYDGNQDLDTVFFTLGHRVTGQEEPYWDNPDGN